MEEQWGKKEVIDHLTKVQEHFGVAGDEVITAHRLLEMLEKYDEEVEPVTQEQANVVCHYVIAGLEILERRN